MSDIGKTALKTKIDNKVYENSSQAITGTIMNEILQDVVDTLADGGNLDAGSVDTANIADGAVTDAKLQNPVSVSQNIETGGVDVTVGNDTFDVADNKKVNGHQVGNITAITTTSAWYFDHALENKGKIALKIVSVDGYDVYGGVYDFTNNVSLLPNSTKWSNDTNWKVIDIPFNAEISVALRGASSATSVKLMVIEQSALLELLDGVYDGQQNELNEINSKLKGGSLGTANATTTTAWLFADTLKNKGTIGINLKCDVPIYGSVYDFNTNTFILSTRLWSGWERIAIPQGHSISVGVRTTSGTHNVELLMVNESTLLEAISNNTQRIENINNVLYSKKLATESATTTTAWLFSGVLNNKGNIAINLTSDVDLYGSVYDFTDSNFILKTKKWNGWTYVDVPQGHNVAVGVRTTSGTHNVALNVVENTSLLDSVRDNIESVNNRMDSEIPITITIGAGQKYTTLKEGFHAAIAKKNTTVIVMPGTYDLMTEFASEIAAYTGNVGLYVGNGMHVIFMAGAKIECIYEMTDNADKNAWMYDHFNPILADLSDFIIENMNIECKNTRYCVHDEGAGAGIYHHKYINCQMKYIGTNPLNKRKQCIGGGLGQKCYIDIVGGIYESVPYSGEAREISYHNGDNAAAESVIFIKDVYCVNGTIAMFAYGQSELISKAVICGCSLALDIVSEQSISGASATLFDITAWNNIIRS